jgi:hypothetical protein
MPLPVRGADAPARLVPTMFDRRRTNARRRRWARWISRRSARPARSGKPGSGTEARFAPIATTRCASSATAPRSTAPGRAGSGSGRPARPAVLVFAAESRWQPRAGRPTDRAPTAHARPPAARVLRRVVTGALTPLLTSVGAPKRVARLGAARARTCKNCNPQPSPQASIQPNWPRRATDRCGNRPEQARAEAQTAWQRLRFPTTVEWAPWRRCNHA